MSLDGCTRRKRKRKVKEERSPANYYGHFLCTISSQYPSKRLINQTTIDYFNTNKDNDAYHNWSIILSCIGGDTISRSLSK